MIINNTLYDKLIVMILGYDFVEERLFAFRDYANLTEEGIKSLRKDRSNIANFLKYERGRINRDREIFIDEIISNSGGDIKKAIDSINRPFRKVIFGSDGRTIKVENPAYRGTTDRYLEATREVARRRAKAALERARNMK